MITMPSVWTSREATLVYVKMVTMVMDLLAQVSYIYVARNQSNNPALTRV